MYKQINVWQPSSLSLDKLFSTIIFLGWKNSKVTLDYTSCWHILVNLFQSHKLQFLIYALFSVYQRVILQIRNTSYTDEGGFKVSRPRFLSQEHVQEQYSFALSFYLCSSHLIQMDHFYYWEIAIRHFNFNVSPFQSSTHNRDFTEYKWIIQLEQLMNSKWTSNTNRKFIIH